MWATVSCMFGLSARNLKTTPTNLHPSTHPVPRANFVAYLAQKMDPDPTTKGKSETDIMCVVLCDGSRSPSPDVAYADCWTGQTSDDCLL